MKGTVTPDVGALDGLVDGLSVGLTTTGEVRLLPEAPNSTKYAAADPPPIRITKRRKTAMATLVAKSHP